MDTLRNLFGNLTAGIIRLLVTVGILAAAYLFILKPILDTADEAIKSTNKTIETSFGATGVSGLDETFQDVNRQVQRQIRRSFRASKRHGNPQRLIRCIQRADSDVKRIQRCSARYSR